MESSMNLAYQTHKTVQLYKNIYLHLTLNLTSTVSQLEYENQVLNIAKKKH